MDKKAKFRYFTDWGHLVMLLLIFIGLIFGLNSPSAIVTYMIGFVGGMMGGRLFWERKNRTWSPYLTIIIGFIMGFVIGTFHGDKRITILLFVFGAVLSYYVLDKGLIKDFHI